jgi:hypothetical protein
MTLQLAGLEPEVRERAQLALDWAAALKIPVTITSVTRGWAEQTKLRARYESCVASGEKITPANPNAACRYPANQPGDSAHNFGLAWDSWVPDGEWQPGWTYWEAWKYLRRWAGFTVPDSDRVHAEVPSWRTHATNPRRG